MPPDGTPLPLGSGRFQFGHPDRNRPFRRFTIRLDTPFGIENSGVLIAQSRIRRIGAGEWLSQSYPMIVEQLPGLLPRLAGGTDHLP